MRYDLKRVVWEITWKCNAKCIHCGSDCISVEKEHQLTTAECLDIIADLKQLGTEIIFLSGGDPLLREDFGALAAAIKNQGMQVAFISNAIALDDDKLKVLKQFNLLFSASVSMQLMNTCMTISEATKAVFDTQLNL